ncbi:hypothetical protein PR048_009137, partial [Dryococelus australis]
MANPSHMKIILCRSLYNVSDIEDVVMAGNTKICQEKEEYMGKGTSVNKLDLLRASSLITLPSQIAALNRVQQYFNWVTLACDVKDGLEIPTPLSQVPLFERNNPVISVDINARDEHTKAVSGLSVET